MSDEADKPIQTTPLDETPSPEDQIIQVTNNWKRAVADLENFRKRTAAERVELLQHAKELTVLKLLPSLQSLEQVLKYAPTDEKYKDWIAGLKATIMQLEKSMEELGVVKIKTVGEKFDPTHHEAIEEKDLGSSPDASAGAGKILSEVQPGFMLNNQVIIPAKVVVGKNTKVEGTTYSG